MKILPTICLSVSLFLHPEGEAKENWPRFHGENGSGVASDVVIPAQWTEADYLWNVELPVEGHGSPVVWGDRIFLLGSHPVKETKSPNPAPTGGKKGKKKRPPMAKDRVPLCVSAKTGEVIWSHTIEAGPFRGHKFNSAGSSTPAVNADRVVYTWATSEELTMASYSHDGELHWMIDLGAVNGGHGYGGSPVIVGDLVVLNNDQEKGDGNLLAVDAATGKIRWTTERKSQRISYSVPCLYRGALIFTNWQHGFTAVDPKTGEVLAEKTAFDTSTNERAISSPIVAGDLVIGTCGFTANPKHCVAMRLNTTNDAFEEVWRIERNVPHIPSLVAVGERVFLIDDSGIVTAVDRATGEEIYKARVPEIEGTIFGSPVSDGERIFFADESGNIHVISAKSDTLEKLATNRLGDLCRSTPAITTEAMFVRTNTKLLAVKSDK